MSADRRPNLPNLVFGICLIFVGGVLALDRMHLVDAIQILRLWPIGLVLFGLSLVAQTMRGGSDVPAAAGEVQGTFYVGPVLGILLVGLLVTQTLRGREATRTDGSGTVSLVAVLGQDQRVSHADRFRGGEMTSVMGGCTLDLRPATLAPGEEATMDVFALMGGIVLRVPEGWTVDVRAVPIMGGVRDQRAGISGRRRPRDGDVEVSEPTPAPPISAEATRPTGGPAPRLVLRGFIMMGGLVIRS